MVELDAEFFDHAGAHWPYEAHGNEDQVGIERELCAGKRFELRGRADPDGVKLPDVALLVAGEFRGGDAPVADAAFFVSAFGSQLQRPERPRSLRRALAGRLRHDLELMHRERLLAMARSQAVGAGVAAADDDDALAGCQDFEGGIDLVAEASLILLRQEVHGEVDSIEIASRDA